MKYHPFSAIHSPFHKIQSDSLPTPCHSTSGKQKENLKTQIDTHSLSHVLFPPFLHALRARENNHQRPIKLTRKANAQLKKQQRKNQSAILFVCFCSKVADHKNPNASMHESQSFSF
jgi:hypothetical protein